MNQPTKNDLTILKPRLRGHFHQAAFFISIGACLMLVASSKSSVAAMASIIYAFSLCGLYGVSALYHRRQWTKNKRVWMKRVDHSAIFILIAGTGTPIFLLSLEPNVAYKLLLLIWGVTILGVLQSLFWIKAPKWISALFYLIAGWMVVPYLPELNAALNTTSLGLIILGGLIYTAGALVYAFKKPNPYPSTFGYHEIFHLLVVIASICHFVVIKNLVS